MAQEHKQIKDLFDGYHAFRELYYHGEKRTKFERLASKGQNPKVMVISCCDSRVDPSMIFGTDPGDLFVVRNVANLVPPCEKNPHYHSTSSALEFAVKYLKVEHVIIMGHTSCGGIQALMEQPPEMGQDLEHSFILHWMEIAEKARLQVLEMAGDKPMAEQVHLCEQKSVEISYQNLETFPFIKEAVAQGKLSLHGWIFDLEKCMLSVYDPQNKHFSPLS